MLRPSALVVGAVVVGLAARLVVLFQLHSNPLLQPVGGLDSDVYVRLAARAAAGDWALGPEPYFVSPLYIYFLAVLRRLFGDSLLVPKLAQAGLGAAAVGLVAATARRLFAGTAAAAGASAVAAWLLALCGVVVFHEVVLLQSSLDPFLTALALYLLVRALSAPRAAAATPAGASRDNANPETSPAPHLAWSVGAGVAFGWLVANRPNAAFAAVASVLALLAVRRTRTGLLHAAAIGLGLLLALAPFALRNRLVAGEWILVSSHGGLNFYIGNNAEADGTYHSVPGIMPSIEGQSRDAKRVAEAALGRSLSSRQVSGYFYDRALEWMRAEPACAVTLFVRKLAYAVNAVEAPLNYSYAWFSRDESTLLRFLLVGSWLLVPLGLVGVLVHPPPASRAAWWSFAAYLPAYLLSLAVFFVSARYRLSLLVPLCVTAAGAAVQLAAWLRAGARWPAAAAAAALAALLVFCSWDVGLDDGRGLQASERVVTLVAEGRDDEARALLARTEPLLDNAALLHYRMGLGYMERGRPNEAASRFARARELDPRQPDIQLSLGQALLASQRPAEAVPHLRAARDSGLSPLESGYDLARALAALGQQAEAIEALRLAARALAHDEGSASPAGSTGGSEARGKEAGAHGADAATAGSASGIGMLALGLGAPDLAEAALARAVALAPGSAEAREAHGLALAQLGRSSDARAELEQALRLDPSRASACFNLAVLELREKRLDQARRLLEQALRVRPDYAQARVLLAQLGTGGAYR